MEPYLPSPTKVAIVIHQWNPYCSLQQSLKNTVLSLAKLFKVLNVDSAINPVACRIEWEKPGKKIVVLRDLRS